MLKLHCNVDYVDLIRSGRRQSNHPRSLRYHFHREESRVVADFHQSSVVAIVAHHDCLANPVAREEHWKLLVKCRGAPIVGLQCHPGLWSMSGLS